MSFLSRKTKQNWVLLWLKVLPSLSHKRILTAKCHWDFSCFSVSMHCLVKHISRNLNHHVVLRPTASEQSRVSSLSCSLCSWGTPWSSAPSLPSSCFLPQTQAWKQTVLCVRYKGKGDCHLMLLERTPFHKSLIWDCSCWSGQYPALPC